VFKIQKKLCAVLGQIAWRCGAARTFGEGLRRSTVAHFARKVSYNAGASTDDYVGQRKSTLRGRCCQYLVFYFEHPTFQGRCRLSANLIFLDFERPTRLDKKKAQSAGALWAIFFPWFIRKR
jgi:hypothetical protein